MGDELGPGDGGDGPGAVKPPCPLAESGRGLLIVGALAARWDVLDRDPPPGRAVRAEVDVPGWLGIARRVGA
ncbi:hypothetical protein [Streptomyces galilaeus]|uniref:hypothetical protein n=1 Tax=Streptomyces galilaeus TaxID=33899 RepID=UPI0038F6757C